MSSTFLDDVERQVAAHPAKIVFRFLEEESAPRQLTYGDLWSAVEQVAAQLAHAGIAAGERVVLTFPPGLEFPVAFIGALRAGVIPVPIYPPRLNREGATALRRVVADSGAAAIFSAETLAAKIAPMVAGVPCPVITYDPSARHQIAPRGRLPEIAYLQYTSGSTAEPKGVVISHSGLRDNLEFIRRRFAAVESTVGVHWLPPYHDMGLVGAILSTAYGGASSVLMSPMHFIRSPVRWLEAISTYGGTASGGPNFAFDLCVDKIDAERRASLDLRSWEIAFNGAERVRASTLRRFAETFAPQGFRASAFLPCYGLAEATLMVSGDRLASLPADDALVGCGAVQRANGDVRIVSRDGDHEVAAGETGEIVISSPSVAAGYWRREAATTATFGFRIDGQPFLRTGDLGLIRDGELVISGRAKEIVIVRGRNLYPEDIEQVVTASHPALAANACAAFAVETGVEEFVIVHEVRRDRLRSLDGGEVIEAIRSAVVRSLEVRPDAILLVRPSTLPKTQNGKTRRVETRQWYVDGALEPVASWHAATAAGAAAEEPPVAAAGADRAAAVCTWLLRRLAREVGTDGLEPSMQIRELALDSLQEANLIAEVAEAFGAPLSPTLLVDYPTIGELAAYLAVVSDVRSSLRALTADQQRATLLALSEELARHAPEAVAAIPEEHASIDAFPEVRALAERQKMLLASGAPNPFFTVISSVHGSRAVVDGIPVMNYSSNNYLGLAEHPRVRAAAHAAVDAYGTSVSASRIVAGERPIHRQLESALAELVGVDDAVAFVGGNTTNVSTVAHLVGPGDLVAYDERSHDSVLRGIALAHATGYAFRHNDWQDVDRLLQTKRSRYRRALVFIEGVYSMDGDIPELPRFIELKRRHRAILMVDECLSIGVLGARGRGIGEHFGIDPRDVDIWMGGLSKALASCGGYIAGSRTLVDYLRYTAPGFIFTTGISPANAAAALAAVEVLRDEPFRLARLHDNAEFFLKRAKDLGMNTGTSSGTPAIPIVIGDAHACIAHYAHLRRHGINVQPIFAPAVPENSSRLRFFVTSEHTRADIETTLATLAEAMAAWRFNPAAAAALTRDPQRGQLVP